jgi:hypothetical protein
MNEANEEEEEKASREEKGNTSLSSSCVRHFSSVSFRIVVFFFLFVWYHFHIRFRQLSLFRCSVGRAHGAPNSKVPIHGENTNEENLTEEHVLNATAHTARSSDGIFESF